MLQDRKKRFGADRLSAIWKRKRFRSAGRNHDTTNVNDITRRRLKYVLVYYTACDNARDNNVTDFHKPLSVMLFPGPGLVTGGLNSRGVRGLIAVVGYHYFPVEKGRSDNLDFRSNGSRVFIFGTTRSRKSCRRRYGLAKLFSRTALPLRRWLRLTRWGGQGEEVLVTVVVLVAARCHLPASPIQYHTHTNARARTRRKNHTHAQRTELTAAAAAKQASAAAAQCRLRCLLIRPV